MAKVETTARPVGSAVDAMLVASRAFVGVVARSLADTDAQLSPSQLRVLMIIATRGTMSLSELAVVMGVHPSNATRAASGLVGTGFLDRREWPADRRRTVLSLSGPGRALVDAIIERRRVAFEEVLDRMSERDQRSLGRALAAFAAAAGEPDEPDPPRWEWVE